MRKKAIVVLEIFYDNEKTEHPEDWEWHELLDMPDHRDCSVVRSDFVPSDKERIVVLNDGETFSSVDGCQIHEVPKEWGTDEIEEYLNEIPNQKDQSSILGEVF